MPFLETLPAVLGQAVSLSLNVNEVWRQTTPEIVFALVHPTAKLRL